MTLNDKHYWQILEHRDYIEREKNWKCGFKGHGFQRKGEMQSERVDKHLDKRYFCSYGVHRWNVCEWTLDFIQRRRTILKCRTKKWFDRGSENSAQCPLKVRKWTFINISILWPKILWNIFLASVCPYRLFENTARMIAFQIDFRSLPDSQNRIPLKKEFLLD